MRLRHLEANLVKHSSVEKDISDHRVTESDECLHTLAVRILRDNHLEGLQAKELLLYFQKFCDVVLELVVLELTFVFWTHDHVLDKLSDLLVELDNIGSLVDEVENVSPLTKGTISICLVLSSSEA